MENIMEEFVLAAISGRTGLHSGGSLTFENPDSRSEVVDSPRSFEGGGYDHGRGDQIVREGIVEVTLNRLFLLAE